MATTKQTDKLFSKKIVIYASVIISGLCWYFSNGLSGDFWYLLWIAPIPVLIISFRATAKITFLITFIAYLIGRLSWFSFLASVATLVPAIIFTIALPLIFALVMLITRRTVIKSRSWYSVFAFPVFFTTFEFLLIKFSADGTAGSIAYSQSNFLPLIQIASVTGILGITFLVTFIPSAIAVGWYYREEKNTFRYIMVISIFIIVSVFILGIIRMNNSSEKNTMTVGLVVLDEKLHNVTAHPEFAKEKLLTESYAKQVSNLAARGAQLVVLPERAININKETEADIINIFSNTAKQNHVFIITGYTNFRNNPERNSALVINAEGKVIIDYNKVHLIKGLENEFTPGREPGLFTLNGIQAGTAICKDLDFPDYIKKYGKNKINFLCIPAWDFIKDDWLHSRMSILRGAENGFSEVRAARLGRLSISDCYGRVTYEANSSDGQSTVLLGKVSTEKRDTIYTRLGDWFGITNLIAAICFIFFVGRNRIINRNLT